MSQIWHRTIDLLRTKKFFTPFVGPQGRRRRVRPTFPTVNILQCAKTYFEQYENPSFTTEVISSNLLGAGQGVIAHGTIPKHQLVCFYPGYYSPPPPVWSVTSATGDACIRVGNLTMIESIYRICCHGGGTIDSTGFPRSQLPPYCHGDIVNHPNKGMKPNVFPVDFYWEDILSHAEQHWSSENNSKQQVMKYAQSINQIEKESIWYIDGSTLEPIPLSSYTKLPAGIALISLETIPDGTELLMDYRFNEDDVLPDWYTPVSYDIATPASSPVETDHDDHHHHHHHDKKDKDSLFSPLTFLR